MRNVPGGRAKKPLVQRESKVQQFTNFHVTALTTVWTEQAHQLSRNIPACPDETRQDFLITVSRLTKGKWLKRRPSVQWGESCEEGARSKGNAEGRGRQRPKDWTGCADWGLNYSFCIFTRVWPVCEVQETFFFIDNRLVITAKGGHLRTTICPEPAHKSSKWAIKAYFKLKGISCMKPDLFQMVCLFNPHSPLWAELWNAEIKRLLHSVIWEHPSPSTEEGHTLWSKASTSKSHILLSSCCLRGQ